MANDELKATKKGKFYILNLQNHYQDGSHWVLLFDGDYYDSYGVVPTTAIAKFVNNYNYHEYQGINKNSCGFYCLYIADNLLAGRDAFYGLIPNKPQYNEDVLKKYFL